MAALEPVSVEIERELYAGRGWRVYRARRPEGPVRLVGELPQIRPGTRLRCEGKWVHHPRYGWQFRVVRFQPEGKGEALIRYLASPLFPGVGPQAARAAVRALGPDLIAPVWPEIPSAWRGSRPWASGRSARSSAWRRSPTVTGRGWSSSAWGCTWGWPSG